MNFVSKVLERKKSRIEIIIMMRIDGVFGKSLSVDFHADFLPSKEVQERHNSLMQASAGAAGRKICRKDAGMDLSNTLGYMADKGGL